MQRATGRRDINKAGGEEAEFPIICEVCLGENPYVRMTKQQLGAECKVCTRPFTVFRWQPGSSARFKKTEVCQTCAKSRNVCQTCLLDLQFGLPTQVRDTALGIKKKAPTSDINREYYAQNIEAAMENGIVDGNSNTGASGAINFGKADPAAREMLKRLARADPLYHRNRPHLCSFFAKGNCNRGDACPYRHEMPKNQDSPLAKQNIQDRFHGTNDPVARKMLSNLASHSGLAPPADESITSLFLTQVPADSNTVETLTAYISPLLSSPEALKSIVPVAATHCAFVNLKTRSDAEDLAEKLSMRNVNPHASTDGKVRVDLGEGEATVQWGRPRKAKAATTAAKKDKVPAESDAVTADA